MRNHLGEIEYRQYPVWKRAVKGIDANAIFEGDRETCYAFHADGIRSIGEWTGDDGVIYDSQNSLDSASR